MNDREVLLRMFREHLTPDVLRELTMEDRINYQQSLNREDQGWTERQIEDIRKEPSKLSVCDGYSGFWTDFEFDEAGTLCRVSAWE